MLRFKDLMERLNIAKTKMGDVIKDFQDSDAPQFKGKSAEKRRQMAIAAKLEADRGVKEEVDIEEEAPKGYGGKSVTGSRAKSWRDNRWLDKKYGEHSPSKSKKMREETGLEEGSYKEGETRMGSVGPITTDAERAERAKKYREKKMAKEEVEQIDELETATLKSYRTKARAQGNAIVDKMKMGGGDWSKDQKDTKTLRKRAAGAQMSGKKLVKRGESLKTENVEQTDEELKGKQHKIDANKNGKIDGHDFKILRNAKKARYQ